MPTPETTPTPSIHKTPTPHTARTSQRKTTNPHETPGPPVSQDEAGTWHLRNYQHAKTLLRAPFTHQAGFRAEQINRMPTRMRPPILFQEGATHREQRTKAAKYFTPVTTSKKYRRFMEAFADELVTELKAHGQADLSQLSMTLAVQVAAQVVGLTNSHTPGMAKRIEAFFQQTPSHPSAHNPRGLSILLENLKNQARVLHFYLRDVQPAIRTRKQNPKDDVISHLLEQGYSGIEILTECITYAAAGMATTREFISASAWHLLENPTLRQQYLAADEIERHAILHELLRLEPVVGHLLRRTQQDLHIHHDNQTTTIPAGSLVDIHIHNTNADPAAVGEDPERYCPHRNLAQGVQPYAMSFGDGHHRCPGSYIAIQETDIFLTRLLALPNLRMQTPPELSWNELVKGYEIRGFHIELA